MRQRIFPIAIVLAALLAGKGLLAQQRGPGFLLSPVFESPRSHAPIQLDAHLSWTSIDLLTGRLQLEFFIEGRLVHTWVSREVVLSASELTLPVMIPPALLAHERQTMSARARFLAHEGVYDLDIHDVPFPVDYKRALVIGIVHPESAAWPPADFTTPFQDRFAWVEPFRLDDALPHKDWSRHISCRMLQIDPDVVPDEPLELVAFDLLILTNGGLSDLDDAQLDAVAAWVEAGGSLCAAGEWAGSEPHRQFLHRVADSTPLSPTIRFNDDGHIASLVGARDWLLASPGVGRAIVTLGPVDVQTPEWRRSVLELWRARPHQIDSIMTTGDWEYAVEQEYWLLDPSFQPLRPDTDADLANAQTWLLPRRVEGVPLPTVATLLLACLLAIAPGDYFLLGWLKRRRWTWVLFPTIALGFAVFTVRLAQSHMGQSDHRTTLNVVDLCRDGRIARTSQIELLFAASDKELQEELSQTMVASLEHRARNQFHGDAFDRNPAAGNADVPASSPALVTGRVPRGCTLVRRLRQWTPRLTRFTTMGHRDDIAVPDVDWSRLERESLRDAVQRTAILNEIQARMPEARIVLLHQNESWRATPVNGDEPADTRDDESRRPLAFAAGLSARAERGMFHIVSQISPNASGNFEDLSIFDRTDPRQWLLLIVTGEDEGNSTVYRRLIRDAP